MKLKSYLNIATIVALGIGSILGTAQSNDNNNGGTKEKALVAPAIEAVADKDTAVNEVANATPAKDLGDLLATTATNNTATTESKIGGTSETAMNTGTIEGRSPTIALFDGTAQVQIGSGASKRP